ncbi:MAG: cobalamin-dependent protein, partial [Nanoarchaeota archaeon]
MSRIKVLPVFPRFPPSFWGYNYAIEMLGKGATMPPTGLATVAAMLPENNFDVHHIIDLNVEPLTDDQIKKSDIIFTSAMIVQRDSLDELVERAHSFDKKIVAGGPYPTSYWKDLKEVDHLVLDEAEATLQPFLEDLLNGSPKRIYNEHSIKSRSDLVQLSRKGKPLLTNTPIPRWDLLKLDKYCALAIQYSRGCPFDCD